ncbi:MAG: cytidylate kinase [Deltaproteobacteria bacterium]|nr:cytidylate kinase [Deltaproteobacteria bacterium]
MAIVTISRQVGSLGTEIAQAVASKLQYEFLDKEKIEKALVDRGLPMPEVEKFDEKKPPFWISWQIQSRRFLHAIQSVVYDFARGGNTVIVGRGGQVLLRDIPGVIHLRVMAPFAARVARIMEREKLDEKQAIRLIHRNDKDSAGFLRFFFEVDWEDPALYDLVINTQRISTETAVGIISSMATSPEISAAAQFAQEKLTDLNLGQKVEATLLNLLGLNIRLVHIQVDRGVITLKGSVLSGVDLENAQQAVAQIEGVTSVDNQLTVGKFYPYGV